MQMPIESINLQMLNVGYAQHNADWNWQNVSSPFTRIFYVSEGEARLHLPDRVVELRVGHLYIIPPHTLHSYECHGPFRHYYIHLYEGFKQETDVFDFFDFPVEVDADSVDAQIFAAICRLHPDAKLPTADPSGYDNHATVIATIRRYNALPLCEKMQLRGFILVLFSRFVKFATPRVATQEPRLAAVLEYIHSNIYSDISVDRLASIACITKPYLIRLFTRDVGVSPLQYINRKKIERAQLLLLTDDMPVKDIASQLGFLDYSYFIRLFRKLVGSTPMTYRATMR